MNQVVHIFAKDSRKHWPEIAASVAVIGLFAWTASYGLGRRMGSVDFTENMRSLAMLLTLLAPVSWWVLITRVVQSESLVGDTQWWITKPYRWGSLLAAKLLFLAVFLVLPLLVAQSWLLWDAGFQPWAHFGALAVEVAALGVMLFLPLMAVGAATATFVRTTVTCLILLVAVIIAVMVLAFANLGRFAVPWPEQATFVVMLGLMAAAILLQYARRRVRWARGMLAVVLVLWLVGAVAARNSGAIAVTYPAGAAKLPVRIEYVSEAGPGLDTGPRVPHRVMLIVPLTIDGAPAGKGVVLKAVQTTVIAKDGRQWSGPWQSLDEQKMIGDSARTKIGIMIDRGFYEAARSSQATLRLRLAAVDVEAGAALRIAMPGRDFRVPGLGICTPQPAPMEESYSRIECRSAIRMPQLTFVTAQWSDSPCEQPGATGASGDAWIGDLTPHAGSSGLNPVVSVPVLLSNPLIPPAVPGSGSAMFAGPEPRRYLCAGTPLTFTAFRPVGNTQYETTLANVWLPAGRAVRSGVLDGNGVPVQPRKSATE